MIWDDIYHEAEGIGVGVDVGVGGIVVAAGLTVGVGTGVQGRADRRAVAGPSRITLDDLERMERGPSGDDIAITPLAESANRHGRRMDGRQAETATTAGHRRRRRRRPRRRRHASSNALALAPLLAMSVSVPTAHAAPPPTRGRARAFPTPTPTVAPRAAIAYPEAVSQLSIATAAPITLDERSLPYVLTQIEDGSWSKIDDAWSLYGRQAGNTDRQLNDDEVATSSSTFAVADALPTGWGVTSNRTSIYRIPLIAVASCILAIVIVVFIIFITLNRRKAHRKARRQADRLRRKALVAAGLTEENINGTAAEAAFKEQLAELEKQHRSRRRGKETSFVRTKVKRWNAGLRRRRKPKGGTEDDGDGGRADDQVLETKADEPIEVPTHELRRRSTESLRSTRSAESARPSVERTSESSPTSQNHSSDEPEPGPGPESDPPQSTAPYFPPAYRPASVRSLHILALPAQPASPSAHLGADAEPASPSVHGHGTEKTTAPGYYPAPATEESEVALAVASRSDGKQRMRAPALEDNDDARVRHIATDDKRVLEQLRLGASAPPRVPLEEVDETGTGTGDTGTGDTGTGESGPSAPHVEVDEQGFERVDGVEHLSPRWSTPLHRGPVHPDIPAPPQQVSHRSLRPSVPLPMLTSLPMSLPMRLSTSTSMPLSMPSSMAAPTDEHDVGTHEQLGELQLLPSAPPTSDARVLQLLPSAPPGVHRSASNAPSAPPLPPEEDDRDGDAVEVEVLDRASVSSVPAAVPALESGVDVQLEAQDEPVQMQGQEREHVQEQEGEQVQAQAQAQDQEQEHAVNDEERAVDDEERSGDDVPRSDGGVRHESGAHVEPEREVPRLMFLPRYEP